MNVPYSAVWREETLALSTSSPLVKTISEFLYDSLLLSILVKKSCWITGYPSVIKFSVKVKRLMYLLENM